MKEKALLWTQWHCYDRRDVDSACQSGTRQTASSTEGTDFTRVIVVGIGIQMGVHIATLRLMLAPVGISLMTAYYGGRKAVPADDRKVEMSSIVSKV